MSHVSTAGPVAFSHVANHTGLPGVEEAESQARVPSSHNPWFAPLGQGSLCPAPQPFGSAPPQAIVNASSVWVSQSLFTPSHVSTPPLVGSQAVQVSPPQP